MNKGSAVPEVYKSQPSVEEIPGEEDDPVEEVITVSVHEEYDIVRARAAGKVLCQKIGFNEIDTTKVVTAISEISRNIFKYAKKGWVTLRRTGGDNAGIEVVATDRGPGIPDVERVLRPDYRSRTGMGGGLRGTRAIMDSFDIRTRPGDGTVVTIRKLLR